MDAQAKLTSKGQVTIPKPVRDAMGLQEGDDLHFRVTDSRATISKSDDFISVAGSVPVPTAKRGTAWDDVLRRTRQARHGNSR
jgi:AbrB family looped-hinge helix DNA binding protein